MSMATSPTEPPSWRPPNEPSVVIVGAGFAGVACAHALGDHGVKVTIIDKNTYHQFQPLLYQVATAQLAATEVMSPLRGLFRKQRTVAVKSAEVTSIDPGSRSVTSSTGEVFTGDYLVLATGSTPNFFGVPGAEENTFPLYSGVDATRLRNRILQVFEDADLDPSRIESGALNFVIVGGGPTGVETAGSLADLVFHVMAERYHDLDVRRARIVLVDHAEVILKPFSDRGHKYAHDVLTNKGVELMLGASVAEVDSDKVVLADGRTIQTHCVVWAGGLETRTFDGLGSLPRSRGGRINVVEDLSVEGYPGLYVVGDGSNAIDGNGKPYPQLASVALQAGGAAATNIVSNIANEPTKPFRYRDRGIMAMIGKRAAIAELGSQRREIRGWIAFLAWLSVHASLMSSTRARMDALISWMWDALSHNRGPAIIDDPNLPPIDWAHPDRTPVQAESDDTGDGGHHTPLVP
jgi:NADH dehydrogenase